MADHRLGFRSLSAEIGPVDLPVEGRFPDWLGGALLRTGPGLFEVGDSSVDHWFDGLSMLYRFAFEGGAVRYTNRLLQSPALQEARAKGAVQFGDFGTTPDRTLIGKARRLIGAAGLSHNANVSVVARADGVFALTETPTPMAFDPETLATLGPAEFHDGLEGHVTSAHPLLDAERGVEVNYLLEFGRKSFIHVYEQALDRRQRRLIGSIPVDRPAYMHSFGMTERYVVLVEPPLRVSPLKMLFSLRPFIAHYEWEQDAGVRFHLMDRRDGSVRTAEGPPCFMFHQVNAFDDGDDVVIDLCAYRDAAIIDALTLGNLRDAAGLPDSQLSRYRIPTRGGTARTETLSAQTIEIPRINDEAAAGRRHSHVWGLGRRSSTSAFLDRIVRVDVEDGVRVSLWEEGACFPTEPVFVPRPSGQRESDGILLSVVLDAVQERSFLLALDAESLHEMGRARLPHAAPFSLHGCHIDASSRRRAVG